MKTLLSTILILVTTFTSSQTRNIRINVYKLEVTQENIYIDLNSEAENLNLCKIQIVDSVNHIVKTDYFPKAMQKPGIKQWTAKTFPISDLRPGRYAVVLYIGKEEFYRRGFRKD